MYELKYTNRDFKGDIVAGGLNGGIFGLVYSFYFLPIDKVDPKLFARFRSSRLMYCGVNSLKMAAGFAMMRSTYNCVKKQELGPKY